MLTTRGRFILCIVDRGNNFYRLDYRKEVQERMEVTNHEIIDYFARANVRFYNAFVEERNAQSQNRLIDRRTNRILSGLIIPFFGQAELILNGTSYDLRPGVIIHAGPQMKLNVHIPKGSLWKMAVLHYDLPEGEKKQYSLYHNHFMFRVKDNIRILDLYQQLYQIQSIPGGMAAFHRKQLFVEILGEMFEASEKALADEKTEPIIEQVQEYILRKHAEGINVNQIADAFDLDRRRLAELFRHHVGMSPSEYLIECRILKAKEFLISGEYPIKVVAESVGYSDSLYFSRMFRKYTGMSPSEYRKQMKDNE